MTSRANPSSMSRHDVRRQLFRTQSSRVASSIQASTAPTGGRSGSSAVHASTITASEVAQHRMAPATSSTSSSGTTNRSNGAGQAYHAASAVPATYANNRLTFIPTKSRGRAIRNRTHTETGGALDGFAGQLAGGGSSGDGRLGQPSSSRWDDSSRLQYHMRKKQLIPTIIAEDEEIIIRSDGGYGDSLEVPLQMIAALRPELMREEEQLQHSKPNCLASVQQSLRAKVAALQNDNWMFMDEAKERSYIR